MGTGPGQGQDRAWPETGRLARDRSRACMVWDGDRAWTGTGTGPVPGQEPDRALFAVDRVGWGLAVTSDCRSNLWGKQMNYKAM